MEAVILTKSRMNSHGVSGVCTTAYDLNLGRIYRFVSNLYGAPIGNPFNRVYECLDVVDVKVLKHCPIGPQTENVLVEQNSFKLLGKFVGDISILFEEINEINYCDYQYMNDSPYAVTYKLHSVENFNHSIEIKKVSNLILKRSERGATSAFFQAYTNNEKHNFQFYRVTDTRYELRNSTSPEMKIGDAYIVVSIPYEPYKEDGYYYKFVAAIYPI